MPLLTQKTVKIIGFSAVAVLGVGGGALVGQPIINSVIQESAALDDAETGISTLESSRLQLQGAQLVAPVIAGLNGTLAELVPSQAQAPALLDTLTLAANLSGIPASSISLITIGDPVIAEPSAEEAAAAPAETAEAPAETEESAEPTDGSTAPVDAAAVETQGNLATIEVGVTASGSQEQLRAFMSLINSQTRVLLVDNFNVSSSEEDGGISWSLTFTADTFVYRVPVEPGAVEEDAESAAEALETLTAAVEASTAAAEALEAAATNGATPEEYLELVAATTEAAETAQGLAEAASSALNGATPEEATALGEAIARATEAQQSAAEAITEANSINGG